MLLLYIELTSTVTFDGILMYVRCMVCVCSNKFSHELYVLVQLQSVYVQV